MKEYKKLYKAGKMWVTATLFALALGGGMFVATQANADSLGNEPTQAVVTTSTQSNGSQTPIATTGNATTQVKYAATNGQVDYNSNYGNLDSVQLKQAANGTVSGNLVGWHAAGASAVQPYHYVLVYDRTDNREITRIHPDSIQRVTRNDVQNVYPNVYNSRNSGFETSFQIPTYTLGHSLSVISRYSNDPNFGEGNRTDYWFNVNLNMGNYANLDKVAVNGNQLHVAGWHATNQAALGQGRNHHYIIAFDRSTGREIARQEVNGGARPDVARVNPGVFNASYSGFNADFDLNSAFVNDEIQFISRWTSDPAGNNDAVDYWFGGQRLFSDHGNYANLDSFVDQNGRMQIDGWHASNQALGKAYHYIIVVDQTTGREVGRCRVDNGQSRNDVARVYPGVFNAAESGFQVSIPYSSDLNGHHLQVVSRWTNDPVGNGNNTTDFWFAPKVIVNVSTPSVPSSGIPGVGDGAGYLDGWRIYTRDYEHYDIAVLGWHALNGIKLLTDNVHIPADNHYVFLRDNTENRALILTPSPDAYETKAMIKAAANNAATGKYEKPDGRPDVGAVYGSRYQNASYSGINYATTVLDSELVFGDDFSIVSRYSTDENGAYQGKDMVFHIGQITRDMVRYGDYREFTGYTG